MNDELYHHGVKGMRWGHRKSDVVMEKKRQLKDAKANYKQSRNKVANAYYDMFEMEEKLISDNTRTVWSEHAFTRQLIAKGYEMYNNLVDRYERDKSAYKQAKRDYRTAVADEKAKNKALKALAKLNKKGETHNEQ